MVHDTGLWPWIARTGWVSTGWSFGPGGCDNSNPKNLPPGQIRVHTVTYKNGDGYGGYEYRQDWGVKWNTSTTYAIDAYREGNMAQIWGPGYYSNDVGSSVYYSWCGHCGGWSYAAAGHWL